MKEIKKPAGGPQIFLDDLQTTQQEALGAIQEQFRGMNAFILQGGVVTADDGGTFDISEGLCYIDGKVARLEAAFGLTLPQKITLGERHEEERALETGGTDTLYVRYLATLQPPTADDVADGVGQTFILLEAEDDGTPRQGLGLARLWQVGDKAGIDITAPEATLDVARGTAPGGTAQFRGTDRTSHFNHATDEHTYIRGGKATSDVCINDNGGKVGIGTDSPSERLEVAGNIKAATAKLAGTDRTALTIQTTDNTLPQGIAFQNSGSSYTWSIDRKDEGSTKAALTISGGLEPDVDGLDEYVRISKDGDVGIGTDSPSEKLQVNGRVRLEGEANTYLSVKETSSSSESRFWTHIDGKLFIQNSKGIRFTAVNGSPSYMSILSDGKVGIGTTSPQDKLDVRGTLRLSSSSNHATMKVGSVSGRGDGLVFFLKSSTHGSNRTVIWNGDSNLDAPSDKRLKTNIANEENILDRLLQLEVKNYNWKDEPQEPRKSIGFIAQEVQPLFPSIVGETEDENTGEPLLTLGYTNFGVLAVGAIKELKQETDHQAEEQHKIIARQNERIAGQDNRINELQNQINRLAERLAALEAKGDG